MIFDLIHRPRSNRWSHSTLCNKLISRSLGVLLLDVMLTTSCNKNTHFINVCIQYFLYWTFKMGNIYQQSLRKIVRTIKIVRTTALINARFKDWFTSIISTAELLWRKFDQGRTIYKKPNRKTEAKWPIERLIKTIIFRFIALRPCRNKFFCTQWWKLSSTFF